jgi:group II intron reverse transcriptase/maturase/CRISPR-associated endonuclease Cas1
MDGGAASFLERMAGLETLRAAWTRVRNKGATGGLDGVTVEDFQREAEEHLVALRGDLLAGRYVPEPLRRVHIPKDTGTGETRVLHLPSVRDKVAQEAARSVLEPVLERIFLDCSYGYRPGKGPARAVARVTHYLVHLKRRWAATADINDFFGSVSHRLLLERLRTVVPDEAFLHVIELWLRMGAVDRRGRWHDTEAGVGQGCVISPLLANFYLHPFDEYMVARKAGLVRYADDFVLLCGDRTEAETVLLSAATFLEDTLGLRLNPNPLPVASADSGFSFLGIVFRGTGRYPDQARAQRRLARVAALSQQGQVAAALRALTDTSVGWRRYYVSLVGPEELRGLHALSLRCLQRVVVDGFRSGHWPSANEAAAALQGVELVEPVAPGTLRRLVSEAAREARSNPTDVPEPGPPAVRSGQGTPSERRERRPASIGLGAHTTDRPPAAVRRVKRRHRRQFAQISELVINTPGAFLGKTSQRVVVRRERRNVCEVPSFKLTGITVASRGISLSADLIDHCAQRDIPVLFVSPQGKVVAFLSAPESSRAATGLLQLRALHEGRPAVELARRFVEGKIRNQMALLKYLHKYRRQAHPAFATAFPAALMAMQERLAELCRVTAADVETVRGQLFSIEGRAAQEYWGLFRLALRAQVEFPGRHRHGATDLVNSLLNYGYAILQARVHLALLRVGLAPQISFLHALQPKGQPTLAFDLMEEFRPQVVDRTVLAMLNRGEPLQTDPQGLLTEATRQRLIARVHDRLATVTRYRGQDLTLEEIIQRQAQLIVRHLKGEARYRPYLAKW